jgi:hypothetical protein
MSRKICQMARCCETTYRIAYARPCSFLIGRNPYFETADNGNLERPWLLELEQDLAATIRSQRLPECFLEPVERVHMLHRGGERSISYEVSELRVKSPADVQKEQSISSV